MSKTNRIKRVEYRSSGWVHIPTATWVSDQQDKIFLDLVASYRSVWPVSPPAPHSDIVKAYDALAAEVEARGQNPYIINNLWVS